jgi:hypothetical protein
LKNVLNMLVMPEFSDGGGGGTEEAASVSELDGDEEPAEEGDVTPEDE